MSIDSVSRNYLTEGCLRVVGQIALAAYRVRRIWGGEPTDNNERLAAGAWPTIYRSVDSPIWLHAASVGEVRGIAPLIAELAEDYELVGSTTSLTGLVEMRKLIPNSALLPFDSRSISQRHLSALRPSLLILNETELWPNLLFAARDCNVPVLLINARISDRSYPRYRKIRWLTSAMLNCISSVLAQTEVDRRRLLSLGALADSVRTVGSTKYDIPNMQLSAGERARKRIALGLDPEAPCLLAGSVREGEYEQVLAAFVEARKRMPQLQLLLAPRHPEYFDKVAAAIDELGLHYNRRSKGLAATTVLLLDTIGELNELYAVADLAFIGGTLVPVGGHNPLEAAAAEIPIFFGPFTQNVRDLAIELCQEGAAKRVNSSSELASELLTFLSDESISRNAQQASGRVVARHRGAVARVKQEVAVTLAKNRERVAPRTKQVNSSR